MSTAENIRGALAGLRSHENECRREIAAAGRAAERTNDSRALVRLAAWEKELAGLAVERGKLEAALAAETEVQL